MSKKNRRDKRHKKSSSQAVYSLPLRYQFLATCPRSGTLGSPPGVVQSVELGGMPRESDDPRDLSGAEIRLVWYPTAEARRRREDGTIVSTMILENCVKDQLQRSIGYTYTATIQEIVAADHAYGIWLRQQRVQGDAATAGELNVQTLKFVVLLGALSDNDASVYRSAGLEVAAGQIFILSYNVLEPPIDRVSELTLDRVFDAVAMIAEFSVYAERNLQKRKEQYERLRQLRDAARTAESEARDAFEQANAQLQRCSEQRGLLLNQVSLAQSALDELRRKYKEDCDRQRQEIEDARESVSLANDEFNRLQSTLIGSAKAVGADSGSTQNLLGAASRALTKKNEAPGLADARIQDAEIELRRLGRVFRGEERRREGLLQEAQQRLKPVQAEFEALTEQAKRLEQVHRTAEQKANKALALYSNF